MPRLSMWNATKNNDYRFFDRTIREQFHIGGTGALVHKYIGPEESPSNAGADFLNETSIQDMLLLENRDRKYDKDIYDMRGIYNISDNDFDLTQFGLFLTNDTLYMTFHLNEMIEMLGRKLMNGDVIELPHLVEEHALDANTPSIPKFYTVTDGNKGGEGFSATWWPHIWRVKLEPITNSQEYDDILGNGEEDGSLANIFSTFQRELDIRDAVVEEASENDPVGGANQLIDHLYNYINDEEPTTTIVDDLNNTTAFSTSMSSGFKSVNVFTGGNFPSSPNQGDFFVRNDFQPNRLFTYKDNKWIRLYDSIDTLTWSNKTFNGATFVNNIDEDVAAGQTYNSRQPLDRVILPRSDYDGDTGLDT